MKKIPALPRLLIVLSVLAGALRAGAVVFTGHATIDVNDASYDGQDIVVSNGVLTVNGPHAFASLRVAAGATLTHSPETNALHLAITNDVIIEAGAAITADGCGFAGGAGSGGGASAGNPLSGGGGGHGGSGGLSSSNAVGGMAYGSPFAPVDWGGGGGAGTGGSGGAGGGAIQLNIGGQLSLHGGVTANGWNATNSRAGGGAGGGIWIAAQTISGAGALSARGGAGEPVHGGGGGGGRIALQAQTNLFAGTILLNGGNGAQHGGAGTLYLKTNSLPGKVIIDNGGGSGANTPIDFTAQSVALEVRGGAAVVSASGQQLINNLLIRSNSTLTTLAASIATLNWLVLGDVVIEPGAVLSVSGKGYPANQGPGVGVLTTTAGGGAGHGGFGGSGASTNQIAALGGMYYDSATTPVQPGSGGRTVGNFPGGAGGGAARLAVNGKLHLDGMILADGTAGGGTMSGGAAGGGIWLTLGGFSGHGVLSANGGAGAVPSGGGGAGGRIAVTYSSNSFNGTLTASGGNGAMPGGAGTIYLKPNTASPSLIVDNGGRMGTNTVLDNISSLADLTIRAGGSVTSTLTSVTVSNLNIGSNAALRGRHMTLTISGAGNVAAGGSITADGASTSGPGNGVANPQGSGGGGYGGYGGRGAGATGGNASGLVDSPGQFGSPGGSAGASASAGAGGGVIRIIVNGRAPFTLDGKISANGFNASSNNAGGGSGGGIWLTLDQLIGSGSISADGGAGHLPNGGGGGGGRISVSYLFSGKGNDPFTNGFTGVFSAQGGNGFARGGAGTVFLRTNNNSTAVIFVDNGGGRGTNTLVSGSSSTTPSCDLFVQGGAVASSLGNPRDLFVRSNGWVAVLPSQQSLTVFITRNATFDAGGGFLLDGLGTSTVGSGSTSGTPKGGGGHGGYGALNSAGSGNVYDSAITPTLSGSPGGHGSGSGNMSPLGGAGGGAARLTVGNTLLLNGKFSADGLGGGFNSGGGSGGGWWIDTLTLTGNGQITARGGAGNGTAGGGGGGRIAIYYRTNLFTGAIAAGGGAGALAGGAGTIYWRDKSSLLTSMLLDNGGLSGANTPLSQSIGLATNLAVSGDAIAEMQGTIPAFSNLVVTAGGLVTGRGADTNLYLLLLGNLTVADGAGISADAKGFTRGNGPGAGGSAQGQGAGGSHGGWGGDSLSGAFSGPAYDSVAKPVQRGSGGGAGSGPPPNGSEGGGALRLAVAGTLALNGFISASGGDGVQDNSGGGAGGSVWISARRFTGHGAISAAGGDGEFYGGGGGGGGCIAIYSPINTFTGAIFAGGGAGADAGEAGTIFTSGILGELAVVSQTPAGLVPDAVNQILLEFNEPLNPLSIGPEDVRLHTPYGMLAQSNFTLTVPAPAVLRVAFPPQNVPGDYRLEVGPLIEGLLASRMSQVHTGAFTSIMPVLSGSVRDTNGAGVAGVLLQPAGGLIPATTDANGNYSLGVPVNWSGKVTPALDHLMFVPGSRNYSGVSADATNQNYLMVPSLSPELSVGNLGANLRLNWNGLPGVTYQVYWSTNLSAPAWYPLDPPVAGTNGVMEVRLPIGDEPEKYFRLNAQN